MSFITEPDEAPDRGEKRLCCYCGEEKYLDCFAKVDDPVFPDKCRMCAAHIGKYMYEKRKGAHAAAH